MGLLEPYPLGQGSGSARSPTSHQAGAREELHNHRQHLHLQTLQNEDRRRDLNPLRHVLDHQWQIGLAAIAKKEFRKLLS